MPAAVLFHSLVKGSASNSVSNVTLRVPVAISAPRHIQVIFEHKNASIRSQLIGEMNQTNDDSWVTHTTGIIELAADEPNYVLPETLDIGVIKQRLTEKLKDSHTVDYLAEVGVSEMGFPWRVLEHWGNTKEMIAKVDAAPEVADVSSLPWNEDSWASILDSATSIGSTLFFDKPSLRMPAHVENFTLRDGGKPPKISYIYVEEASSGTELASDITVLGEDGQVLAKFTSMRFSEIEGTAGVSGSVESLVHQMNWKPATLAETATAFEDFVFLSDDLALVKTYQQQLPSPQRKVSTFMLNDWRHTNGKVDCCYHDT